MSTRNRITDYTDPESAPSARVEVPRQGMLQVIWGRRWWVLLVTLVCIGGTAAYVSRQIPIFSSSSSLYVQQRGSLLVQGPGLSQQTPLVTQCDIVRSAAVLGEVAALPEVRKMQIMAGATNPVSVLQAGLTAVPAAGGRTDTAGRPDMMVISFESPNSVEASQIVNFVAEAYARSATSQKKTNAVEVFKLLTAEKVKRDEELQKWLDETLKFKKDNGVLSFQGDRGNIIIQTLGKLSDALTTTQMELIDAQAEFDAMEKVKGDDAKLMRMARLHQAQTQKDVSINVEQATAAQAVQQRDTLLELQINVLSTEIDQLERQRNRLLQLVKPEHADVRILVADLIYLKQRVSEKQADLTAQREAEKTTPTTPDVKVGELKRQREIEQRKERDRQIVEAYVESATYRLSMVTQRAQQLQKAFDAQKEEAFKLNAVAAKCATLETELHRVEKLCDIIDTRIKELNVSEDTGSWQVSVIEVATPSVSPIRPQKTRTLAMGLLIGVILGVGVALGLDFMDQRIHSVEEVSALADAPVLGLVPHISVRQSIAQRGRHVANEPTSDVAESYRTIRTAVYFGARNAQGKGNRLLVTSPAPGDGKTTSVSNLAIAMANAGQRVILVDADLRRPTQHKVFEMDGSVGVSSVMAGEVELAGAILATGINNLDLLPAGSPPANPSEILNSQAFADLIDGLAERYDHVLIDSPPVAPVTDARILGAMCDATILVVRAEKSTKKGVEHARESLKSVGTNVLGVVINDVPRRRDRYGYYYGYTYGYRYRQYGYTQEATTAKGNGDSNGNGNGNGHSALAVAGVAGTNGKNGKLKADEQVEPELSVPPEDGAGA